ncbi:hypothetical protein L2D01_13495 [Hyphomonadaceae bacterium ML37]|nr:hypothetical protein L2D01_13495 [Hyphomonadaceae bacterium ML37]
MPFQFITAGLIAAAMLASQADAHGSDEAGTQAMRAYSAANLGVISSARDEREERFERAFPWLRSIMEEYTEQRRAVGIYGKCYRFDYSTLVIVAVSDPQFVTESMILFGAAYTQYMSDVTQAVSDVLAAGDYSQLEMDLLHHHIHWVGFVYGMEFGSSRQPAPDQCASAEQVLSDYVRVND